jgi:hypothetical protein
MAASALAFGSCGSDASVHLTTAQSVVHPGDVVEVVLDIEGDPNDIIYGGHHTLEKSEGARWVPKWVMWTHVGDNKPTSTDWHEDMLFADVGYSGEGTMRLNIPDSISPGAYRLVFEYTDMSVPTSDEERSGTVYTEIEAAQG